MYYCLMYSKDLIKGTLQPLILKLLEENQRMYGYEITQRVKELTHGKIVVTEGALYPLLHKLEAEGTLQTEKEFIGKRVRKYYSLTQSGKSVVQQKVEELSDFLKTMGSIIHSKPATE